MENLALLRARIKPLILYPLGFAMAFSGVADLAPENARGRMSSNGQALLRRQGRGA
jgi:hypothetical protein